MEGSFYIIIMFLIFLKLMIWLCVFYARARQRRLTQQNHRGIIIIQSGSGLTEQDIDGIITREHLPDGVTGGIDNPALWVNPPSYEEAQQIKSMEEKPPTYDQVLGGNYQSQNFSGVTAIGNEQLRTPVGPVAVPPYNETERPAPAQS